MNCRTSNTVHWSVEFLYDDQVCLQGRGQDLKEAQHSYAARLVTARLGRLLNARTLANVLAFRSLPNRAVTNRAA